METVKRPTPDIVRPTDATDQLCINTIRMLSVDAVTRR